MRYIVSFLIAIGLIILFIILLLKIIFGGNNNSPESKVNLADYAHTNVIMRMVAQGPITANQDHHQVYIEVGKDDNEIQLVRGYQGEVTHEEQFDSNSSSYGNFLRAIDLLGYTNGDTSEERADYRGHCPFGNRYIFQIIDGTKVKQQFWATSCGDREGTFRGQTEDIIQLFQAQIPGYSELTTNLDL